MVTRVVLVASFVLTAVAPVAADTVWLANGRVLQADSARVVGDRVLIQQRGLRLSLPVAAVVRIRRDEQARRQPTIVSRQRPPVIRSGRPEPAASAERRDLRGLRERARLLPRDGGPSATAVPSRANPFELDPASAEYWRERAVWIHDRIRGALDAARGGDRRWNRRRTGRESDPTGAGEAVQRLAAFRALERALRDEARRLGVPERWLDGSRAGVR